MFERLPVPLTREELLIKGDELAKKLTAKRALEDKKKEKAALMRADMKELDKEIDELRTEVREKRELRPVQIEVEKDFERHLMHTVRIDTGERIRSRPMTLDERQIAIFPPLEVASEPAKPKRQRKQKQEETSEAAGE